MTPMRTSILSIALLTLVTTASAVAQNQTPSETAPKPAAVSPKIEDVTNWTKKQWYAAKAKWIKEKVKWADCQTQAVDQKLSGRKSWVFLYNCMTK